MLFLSTDKILVKTNCIVQVIGKIIVDVVLIILLDSQSSFIVVYIANPLEIVSDHRGNCNGRKKR
jgi:hypothetical protein